MSARQTKKSRTSAGFSDNELSVVTTVAAALSTAVSTRSSLGVFLSLFQRTFGANQRVPFRQLCAAFSNVFAACRPIDSACSAVLELIATTKQPECLSPILLNALTPVVADVLENASVLGALHPPLDVSEMVRSWMGACFQQVGTSSVPGEKTVLRVAQCFHWAPADPATRADAIRWLQGLVQGLHPGLQPSLQPSLQPGLVAAGTADSDGGGGGSGGNCLGAVADLVAEWKVQEHVDLPFLLGRLVRQHQWNPMSRLLALLSAGPRLAHQKDLIRGCLQLDEAKSASLLIRRFNLRKEFAAEADCARLANVRKLVRKGKWQIASLLVGEDEKQQCFLVREMASIPALRQAAIELRTSFQLESVLPEVAAWDESRDGPLPYAAPVLSLKYCGVAVDAVVMVDDWPSLQQAAATLLGEDTGGGAWAGGLHGERVVGIDVEWQPAVRRQGPPEPASILQIGTGSHVFLFDLIALLSGDDDDQGGEPAAGKAGTETETKASGPAAEPNSRAKCRERCEHILAAVFGSAETIVLGFAVAGDLRMLRKSYPHSRCFDVVRSLLDVDAAATTLYTHASSSMAPAQGGLLPGGGQANVNTRSLSSICQSVLGRPMDKGEQCSAWRRRPLTDRQVAYAALDALALVRLFQRMQLDAIGEHATGLDAPPCLAEAAAGARPRTRDDGNDRDDWWRTSAYTSMPQPPRQARAAADAPPPAPAPPNVASLPSTATSRHVQSCLRALGLDDMLRMCPSADANDVVADLDGNHRGAEGGATAPQSAIECKTLLLVGSSSSSGHPESSASAVSDVVCVVVLRCSSRLDLRRVAMACPGARGLRLAPREQVIERFGFVPGTVGPVGLRCDPAPMVVVDRPLITTQPASGDVVAPLLLLGCGVPGQVFAVPGPALVEALGATVAGISVEAPPLPPLSSSASASSSSSTQPPPSLRFIVGPELRRLGRWLRVVGADAVIAGCEPMTNAFDVPVTDMRARARKETRVILTRDRAMCNARESEAFYFVASNDVQEQFDDVTAHFGLGFDEATFMTRCSACNGDGFDGPLTASAVAPLGVPPKVLAAMDEFWVCKETRCGKVFWRGPKFRTAYDKFKTGADKGGGVGLDSKE